LSHILDQLAPSRKSGHPSGIASICSAHPTVLRAAIRHGVKMGTPVLIEATCNQVNQLGGYTGMRPADFASLVNDIAEEEQCPRDQVILGGDHLGPNPWRHLQAEEAMHNADRMVEAYVRAGFRKIHLDTSMGCKAEPVALRDLETAQRAVRLAAIAEQTAIEVGGAMPRYIIGTEVPPPGGADHSLDKIIPTDPGAAQNTINVHRTMFCNAGIADAFSRVIGLVVQPGVEFGNQNIINYDRTKARSLVAIIDDEPGFVFEAHSTDYQGTNPLKELVADGFSILKVGPELTFVLREALYALDAIATDLVPEYGERPLKQMMEKVMLDRPEFWQNHYRGDPASRSLMRHYSLSDRIRYYWPDLEASAAVARLAQTLEGKIIPLPLFWQHFPAAQQFAEMPVNLENILLWRITQSLESYHSACHS